MACRQHVDSNSAQRDDSYGGVQSQRSNGGCNCMDRVCECDGGDVCHAQAWLRSSFTSMPTMPRALRPQAV